MFALAQEGLVGASRPDGSQLREKCGTADGQGIGLALGPKFMQQPDAVPLADPEGGGDLLAAEPLSRYWLLEDFFDGVEAAKPFRGAGDGISSKARIRRALEQFSLLEVSLHEVARFCHYSS